MFSLVVSVISIALVTILGLAGLYYGGATLWQASPKAEAARISSESEQLRLAIQMYAVDHNNTLPETMADLTADGKYLREAPNGWTGTSQYFTKENYDISKDTCLVFNQGRGIPFVPECTDEIYRNVPVCCRNTLMSAE